MVKLLKGNPRSWKIVLAIFVKDLIDAVRNWATLTVIVGTAMVLLTAQAGSILANLVDQKIVYVYDPGRSSLLRTMRRFDEPRVVPVPTIEELEIRVGDAPDVRIGLIFPADVELRMETGDLIVIDVLRSHWSESSEVRVLLTELNEQIRAVTDGEIEFQVLSETAYPQLASGSRSVMVTSALVLGVLVVGTFLTPYLLAEEREEGTLSVLRLSPATGAEIVLAKAMVGLTYCLIVGSTALLFNWHFVVHAWIGFATILVLGFFAVCLGLFLGLFIKQMSTINLWMGVALLVLIIPTIVMFMDRSSMPDWASILLDWFPTVAASKLLRISFLERVDARMLIQPLVTISGFAAAAFAGVLQQLHREDRI